MLFYKFVISKFTHTFMAVLIDVDAITIHSIVLKLSNVTTTITKLIGSNAIGLIVDIRTGIYIPIS